MKKVSVMPIDFMGQGAMLQPKDAHLHDMAVAFCEKELAEKLMLTSLQKVWVVLESDDESGPVVTGVAGYVNKIDIPVFRGITKEAVDALSKRVNDYLADNGLMGHEIFIHIAKREKPEQRCPNWKEALQAWGAESSDRLSVKIR